MFWSGISSEFTRPIRSSIGMLLNRSQRVFRPIASTRSAMREFCICRSVSISMSEYFALRSTPGDVQVLAQLLDDVALPRDHPSCCGELLLQLGQALPLL